MRCPSNDAKYPQHAFEQFHPDYNPDGIDALVEEAKVWKPGLILWLAKTTDDGWLWLNSSNNRCLGHWERYLFSGNTTQITLPPRNPYYWKVDTEGNQYPYIEYTAIQRW